MSAGRHRLRGGFGLQEPLSQPLPRVSGKVSDLLLSFEFKILSSCFAMARVS